VSFYFLLLLGLFGLLLLIQQGTSNAVGWSSSSSGLQNGDQITAIAGNEDIESWEDVRSAVNCWPAKCAEPGECEPSFWDSRACECSKSIDAKTALLGLVQQGYGRDIDRLTAGDQGSLGLRERLQSLERSDSEKLYFEIERTTRTHGIPATLERAGVTRSLILKDPAATQRAGEVRTLQAGPSTTSPVTLGIVVFLIGFALIGTHSVLTGTATLDYAGTSGLVIAVALADGAAYAGSALQSALLAGLTAKAWLFWPLVLIPFATIGVLLSLRFWSAGAAKS